jgi:predicted N-formylglutamate amidohydrolase
MNFVRSQVGAISGLQSPEVRRGSGKSDDIAIVFVCEHAANAIPVEYGDLGLAGEARRSHIAWDLGALAVARAMRDFADGDLVAGSVSRLVHDCNRPPGVSSAMPELSGAFAIPGNRCLDEEARAYRAATVYQPFHAALTATLDVKRQGALVTIHSFTPVFDGIRRNCEVGILHDDADPRLALALLAAADDAPFLTELNVPYSAADGVTHTLKKHAVPRGWLNAMIEIRNDLIATPEQQDRMALQLVALLRHSIRALEEVNLG